MAWVGKTRMQEHRENEIHSVILRRPRAARASKETAEALSGRTLRGSLCSRLRVTVPQHGREDSHDQKYTAA
jgi:hypothetical protein